MAGGFVIQTQNQAVQVLGESTIRNVMQIGFTTVPSNVYAIVEIPLQFWRQFGSTAYVDQVASLIEAAMSRPDVVGAEYVQDLDETGLLTAFVEFIVSIQPPNLNQFGPMTARARVSIKDFTEPIAPLDAVMQPIVDAVAALTKTATE